MTKQTCTTRALGGRRGASARAPRPWSSPDCWRGSRRPYGRAMRSTVRRGLSAGALALACLADRRGRRTRGTTAASSAFSTAALAAAAPPAGFQESIVWSGLSNPTAIRFADDGRVFVAEQGGLIKVFDSLDDPTRDDLRRSPRERPLVLGPRPARHGARPGVHDRAARTSTCSTRTTRAIGGSRPTWGDACPTPPGATRRRLRRQRSALAAERAGRRRCSSTTGASSTRATRSARSRSARTARSTPRRGDGASFTFADYGQDGNPVNPCGDPAGDPDDPTPPTAEGGALRSQDIRTTGDPTGLDGTIIRINPDTGAAMPDNPNAASADANTRRIIAHGFRNPFRFTFRPGHERSLRRRRRLEHLGGDRPRPERRGARRELRLALLRGRGPACRPTTSSTSTSASPLQPPAALHRAALHLQPLREGRRRDLPDRHLVDLRARVLRRRHVPEPRTTARCSSPTTRATASG